MTFFPKFVRTPTLFGLALTCLFDSAWATPAEGVQRSTLQLASQPLHVELATTPAQRARGLMGRGPLARDEGMLFVFPDDAPRCLWMRDTPSPLAAAFLDARGRVLNMVEMAPLSDTRHCSNGPARYALEVGPGEFARRGVRAGQQVGGLDSVPAVSR